MGAHTAHHTSHIACVLHKHTMRVILHLLCVLVSVLGLEIHTECSALYRLEQKLVDLQTQIQNTHMEVDTVKENIDASSCTSELANPLSELVPVFEHDGSVYHNISLLHCMVLEGELDRLRNLSQYMTVQLVNNRVTRYSGVTPVFSSLSPLWHAARYGNLAMVTMLVEAGAVVDSMARHTRSQVDTSPLAMAVTWGHTQVVIALLKQNADVDLGESPLVSAAEEGSLGMVRLLLQAGAEVDRMDSTGHTALLWASYGGKLEIVKLLLEHGADPSLAHTDGSSPVSLARDGGHTQLVQLLTTWGGDSYGGGSGNILAEIIPQFEVSQGRDSWYIRHVYTKCTLLHRLVAHGNSTGLSTYSHLLTEDLVDSVCSISWTSYQFSSVTALWLAAQENHPSIARLLFRNGADQYLGAILSGQGSIQTPLFRAALAGHTEVLRLLLKYGASTQVGESPLVAASTTGEAECVSLLLEAGADPNMEDSHGVTPLLAVKSGRMGRLGRKGEQVEDILRMYGAK